MGNLVFNFVKGRAASFVTDWSAQIAIVPLEKSGLQPDAELRTARRLDDILMGTTNEQVNMGRKWLTNAQLIVDDVSQRVVCTADDVTWPAATGPAVGAMVICHAAAGIENGDRMTPLTMHSFSVAPDGADITVSFTSHGFYRAV